MKRLIKKRRVFRMLAKCFDAVAMYLTLIICITEGAGIRVGFKPMFFVVMLFVLGVVCRAYVFDITDDIKEIKKNREDRNSRNKAA